MIEHIAQVGIATFGSISLFLVAKNNRWGFVHGLISQFFFVISSFIDKQTGVLLLSLIEIIIWSYGIYRRFFRKAARKEV